MNRKKLQKLTDNLAKNCKHFNKHEVSCLVNLFYNLVGEITERQSTVIGLDRNAFRNILHMTFGMTDDMIMDRVFRGFDKDNDGCVNISEWINGLSLFLRGTLEEKMKYCFDVFDLNGDGFISKEEMFHMLKNSLLKQPSEEDPDEGIKDLVEITLKKMVNMDDLRFYIEMHWPDMRFKIMVVIIFLLGEIKHLNCVLLLQCWKFFSGFLLSLLAFSFLALQWKDSTSVQTRVLWAVASQAPCPPPGLRP
nr:calaxin isoform X1 [Dasypus novemcinctus]